MFTLFLFLFNFSFSQIIDHQVESNVLVDSPYEIKVYSDYNILDIEKFNIYYRTNSSNLYLKGTLNSVSANYFSYIIPQDFIVGKYLEYYILIETVDGVIKTIPEIDPYDVPISLRISDEEIIKEEFQSSGLDNNVSIISPQPNQVVSPDDVFIALSYFRMNDIDESKIQVIVDDVNTTASANIYPSNLTLIPNINSSGKHQIKVILYNKSGEQYNPIIWNFYIESLDYIYSTSKKLSGKFSNDYLSNNVDKIYSYSNNTNFDMEYNSNWISIKSKLKKSSLENNLIQPKDRYNINLKLNNINIDYGDFYPNLNDLFISGNRVRGFGLNYKSKFFQLDLISGELARAVQGDPNNDAVLISDFTSNYDFIEGYDQSSISISRSGYTFKRDVYGLRLGFGHSERLNFGFNILKAKDQINSVRRNLDGAAISLPYEYEIFDGDFNSDKFIDINEDGQYTFGETLLIDYNENDIYDEGTTLEENLNQENYISAERVKVEGFSTYCYDFDENNLCTVEEEIKPTIQWVWDIKVSSNNIVDYIDSNNIDNEETNDINESININFLEKEWSGAKPQDNIVLGTDFSLSSKNKNLKMNSSFAMSLINGNIWNPVKKAADFDTYNDVYEDCEFGTTYSNPELLTEDCTDSYQSGGCNPYEHYWHECIAYVYINGNYNSNSEMWEVNKDIEVELSILQQGIPLDAIPSPEDFEDIFHYNFDAIPSIPFYSIIQKLSATGMCDLGTCGSSSEYVAEIDCLEVWSPLEDEDACAAVGGEWKDESESFILTDILNSPEVAYDIDFSLKLLNNQIKFGIKQVGQSFNSLGNPYLQKDMREKYFSDRIRLFENRMFVTLKMSHITNGISDDSNPDLSKKYDFNLSYYPGINYPSFNLSFANYNRKSGQESIGNENQSTSWVSEDVLEPYCNGNPDLSTESLCENDIFGAFDTRLNTQTNNFNLSINYNFESNGRVISYVKSKIKKTTNSDIERIYKQNMTLTYFSSSKEDLMFPLRGYLDQSIGGTLDPDYLSPRSKNINFGINLKTTFNSQWESNASYSNSYFDYAQKGSDFFEKQKINTLSSSFNYKVNQKIENVGLGLDYVIGSGTRKYNQFTLQLYSEFLLLQNMNLNVVYNYKIKNSVSSDDYINSLFKINISYRF